MYREDQSGGSFMLGVLTGAFVGAGLALLFAPKSGPEMRAQLNEQYRGLADRVGEQTQNLRSAAGQWRGELSDRVSSLKSSASAAMERQGGSQTSESDRFPTSAPTV
jgi:gas vesicle protein